MNQRQKLVQQQFLNNEQTVIKRLEYIYDGALSDINKKIRNLEFKIDDLTEEYDWLDDGDPKKEIIRSKIQSKIYQKQYQEALQGQIDGILNQMQTKQYLTVSDYLSGCYEDGFIGSLFDLHGQGVPLTMPLDQTKMIRAVQLESKISKGLYTKLGEDVGVLKKRITSEVTRSIATGASYAQCAQRLAGQTKIGYNKAVRIARTEGHRIQTTATMDTMYQAKERGADVVKQWDATLDGLTRESHVAVDGEIRELDEAFSNGLDYPGDPAGGAAEVVNCRCAVLQRARWAVGDGFTKWNNISKEIEAFDSPQDYAEFKKSFFSPGNKKYMDYVQQMEGKYGKDFRKVLDKMTDLEYKHYSKLLTGNPVFNTAAPKPSPNATLQQIGKVDCWVEELGSYGFTDGTGTGIKKTVPAVAYTVPDGTRFIYPKKYDKTKQTLTPELAITTWQRVPDNIRGKIQKTVEVVDYYNPQDSYWKKVYKNFGHSYATGGDTITFYRSAYHDPDYLLHTFCHEGGHYIDYTLPGTSKNDRYCQQFAWQTAMAKDLATSGKKSWRAYGENSPLEDFADSVGYYTTDRASFAATFPERTKLLDIILK